ncbi:hypothetical protein JKG68_13770 [Microvirga aerilata]|uniref:Uncharacterized protein n=1 Tax=Microvirga aerilata TaxID=670292 RepID=A0A936ZC38_9HYPH|nr:hypothetical protein [Microvirga aerilata]MBL0405040.1 hypothetical protein [Microvirga aerilata]
MSPTPASRPSKTAPRSRKPCRPRDEDVQVHPDGLGSLFATRPLVWGESAQDYDTLLIKVTAAIKPTDVIEAMWVRDITDLMWEGERLRRLKNGLLRRRAQEELEDVLEGIEGANVIDGIPSIAACYSKGHKPAVTHIKGIFAEHDLDDNEMTARAFAFHFASVERIERMIAGVNTRRDRVIGELDRYREGGKRRSRMITDDVTDID